MNIIINFIDVINIGFHYLVYCFDVRAIIGGALIL